MENKFTQAMVNRSDSELLEIVTKLRDDYQAEAIKAAEIEIENRNLSTVQVENAEKEIKQKEIKNQEKENEALGAGQKVLFFIFFWGIIPWGIAGTFKADGFERKYKEAWKFMKYGLFSFIGFNGLMFLLAYLAFR